jgi:hypothetical protein
LTIFGSFGWGRGSYPLHADSNRFEPGLFHQAGLRTCAGLGKLFIRNGFWVEGQIWANQKPDRIVEEILTGKSDHGRDHDSRLAGKAIAATDLTKGDGIRTALMSLGMVWLDCCPCRHGRHHEPILQGH